MTLLRTARWKSEKEKLSDAQKLKNDKKLTDARAQFIICAREICPSVVRVECAKSLAEVENATSTIVIRARDAVFDPIAEIDEDGTLRITKPEGSGLGLMVVQRIVQDALRGYPGQ